MKALKSVVSTNVAEGRQQRHRASLASKRLSTVYRKKSVTHVQKIEAVFVTQLPGQFYREPKAILIRFLKR